jgi:hypothetical protein
MENRTLLSGVHGIGTGKGNTFDPNQFGPAVVTQSGANGYLLTIDNAHTLQVLEQDRGVYEVYDKSGGGTSAPIQTFRGVTQVVINGTSGGDILNVGNDYATVTVNAGAGVDQIGVADNIPTDLGGGSTTVFAGGGNDVITVGNFNDGTKVFGQGGHDKYTGPASVFAQ